MNNLTFYGGDDEGQVPHRVGHGVEGGEAHGLVAEVNPLIKLVMESI